MRSRTSIRRIDSNHSSIINIKLYVNGSTWKGNERLCTANQPDNETSTGLDFDNLFSALALWHQRTLPDSKVFYCRSLLYASQKPLANNFLCQQTFTGTSSQQAAVKKSLPYWIRVLAIKLNPRSWNFMICMRMELYGISKFTKIPLSRLRLYKCS